MKRAVLLAPLLLAACSATPDAAGAGTADEERQLNEAAEMLDANSVSLNALNEDDGPDGEGADGVEQGPQE